MKLSNFFVPIFVLLVLFVSLIAGLFADLYWFQSLGFETVFLTVLFARLFLFLELAIAFYVIFLLMYFIASRTLFKKQKFQIKFFKTYAFLAVVFGFIFSSEWLTVLKYGSFSEFGVLDPIFALDISFYVFELPFYFFIWFFLFAAFLVAFLFLFINRLLKIKPKLRTVTVGDESFTKKEWDPIGEFRKVKEGKAFFFISGAIGLVLFALMIYLQRFELLFSDAGAAFGASYVDVNVTLPIMNILVGLLVLAGLVFLFSAKTGNSSFAKGAIALIFILGIFGGLAGGVVQALQVSPDEFNFEKPFIERNIEFTNIAYALNEIEEKPFNMQYNLTAEDLLEEEEIMGNIRVWDWRPLRKTFSELQLFRTYYDFADVDVDRYEINGVSRQVMISAREIDIRDLPDEAQTWINEHLVYTHGYGAVSVPVNMVSEEGLPEFFLKDLPPKNSYPKLKISQPEIYFGEDTHNFVVTNTNTEEFDYPSGSENVYTSYKGNAGVKLDSLFTKLVYAIKFASIPLLFSASITDESKLLLNRDIFTRLYEITPFLSFDGDPYIVIADEKMYWMIDGYTLTDAYPYSTPFSGLNYLRNSVKVVIDAYNGSVTYYVMESEPLIETYRGIFPELFKDFSEMPSELKKHIRYPEDLFYVQSYMYGTYHMKNPQVFYNKEDLWIIPNELYHSSKQPVEPYYVITKIAGEKEGFVLILPFTPKGKQNMIGWLAAKSDPENYGEKTVFKFSKQELAYGPMQVESRIDQDSEISQVFTLWGQQGSEIIRGNLLVIPIHNSVLYIEPVYLQATTQGAIPELKRVIVVYNDHVVMEETLEEALEKIFGTVEEIPITETPGAGTETPTDGELSELSQEQLISKANSLYEEAQEALTQGDFSLYAEKIEELGLVLEELEN